MFMQSRIPMGGVKPGATECAFPGTSGFASYVPIVALVATVGCREGVVPWNGFGTVRSGAGR